jgi:hypothetical protein
VLRRAQNRSSRASFIGPDESQTEAVLSTTWSVVHALFVAGAIPSLFGLTGLYAYQAEGVGKMGLIGFVLAFIGVTLTVSGLVLEAFVAPLIAAEAPKLLAPSGPLLAGPLGILRSTALALPVR